MIVDDYSPRANWLRRSEKDVADEGGDVGGGFVSAADEDDELAFEAGGKWEALDGFFLRIEGECAGGNDAAAHAEGNEVDDEVEVVELAVGLKFQAITTQPLTELLAGPGLFFVEEPALRDEPFATAKESFAGEVFGGEGGRGDEGEYVVETVGDVEGGRQARWRIEDSDILFVGFESEEDIVAAAEVEVVGDVLLLAEIGVEESWQVGEADGAGDIDADEFGSAGVILFEGSEGGFDIADEAGGFAVKELARRCGDDGAGGAFQQFDSEGVFHALHLAGDGALSEASEAGGFGEAAVFHDELEEGEFVKIEGNSGEELIHSANECILLMNFRQL